MTQILNYADPGTTKGTAVATFAMGSMQPWTLIGLCIVKRRLVPHQQQCLGSYQHRAWLTEFYVSHSWGSPAFGPCLYEQPQVYPYGKLSLSRMTAQANDLIAIGCMGAQVAAFMANGQGTGSIKPREWKGQVKKPQHHRKVLQVLTASEAQLLADAFDDDTAQLQAYVEAACAGSPYSAQVTDLLDAVALGLADNGRLRIV